MSAEGSKSQTQEPDKIRPLILEGSCPTVTSLASTSEEVRATINSILKPNIARAVLALCNPVVWCALVIQLLAGVTFFENRRSTNVHGIKSKESHSGVRN